MSYENYYFEIGLKFHFQTKKFSCDNYFDYVVMKCLFDFNVPVELRNIVFKYVGKYGFAEHAIFENTLLLYDCLSIKKQYDKNNILAELKFVVDQLNVFFKKKILDRYTNIEIPKLLILQKYEEKTEQKYNFKICL
jgi:hypothetical protein